MTTRKLEPIDENIWELRGDLFMPGGVHFPVRTTVLREGSNVIVHSPIAFTEDHAREIDALGTVTDIIAPNLFHHLYAGDAKSRWPTATLRAPRGLSKKRPDLAIDTELSAQSPWSTIDILPIEGHPMREFVFFHRPTSTLVITDLVFNIHEVANWRSQFVFKYLARAWQKVQQSRLVRYTCKDRDAFRESGARLLELPFERVVVAHGEIVDNDAKETLSRGLSWMLDTPASPRSLTP